MHMHGYEVTHDSYRKHKMCSRPDAWRTITALFEEEKKNIEINLA